MNLITKLRIP